MSEDLVKLEAEIEKVKAQAEGANNDDLALVHYKRLAALEEQKASLMKAASDFRSGSRRDSESSRLIFQLSQDNGSIVEESVRSKAESKFGTMTVSTFLLRSVFDLAKISLPHETSQDQIQLSVIKIIAAVEDRFADYVTALQDMALKRFEDAESRKRLEEKWVEEKEIKWSRIGQSLAIIKSDGHLAELVKKVLFVNPKKSHAISPFMRSDGPGLGVCVWSACGEFVDELELDCRGKVDLLSLGQKNVEYGKAVVMGAEVKRSSTAFSEAKKQLLRRFKLIAFTLKLLYGMEQSSIIFIGRVFYRHVPANAKPESSEDGSGNGLEVVSFYYHRM